MSVETIEDEVVGTGPVTRSAGGGLARRAVVEETIGSTGGKPTTSKASGVEDDQVRDNGGGSRRPMKESTLKLLEVADRDPDDEATNDPDDTAGADPDDEATHDPDDIVDDAASKKPEPKVEAKPEEKPETVKDEKPSDYDEIRSDRERLAAHNRQLVDALENERKRPRAELDERLKTLDELEKGYLDDSIGSIRRLIATVLNVKPDAKEVDEELEGLYTDLTAKQLNVPLEAAHKATREAARTKQQLARDKRERQAESEASKNKTVADDDTQRTQRATEFVNQLFIDKPDIAEKYPLMMQLSERFDGMKPATLVWRMIERESKSGNIKVSDNDVDTVEQAAKLIEAHYEKLVEIAQNAKNKKTSTTKQTESKPDAPKTESKEQRQSTGARTITNANASVAPATPPAKKQVEKKTEERPKFKSNKEAQDWALRHLD